MQLLAPDESGDARREMKQATGVACSSISSEATKDAAIVVWGGGPRVRTYCIYGEDAITGEGVNEDTLPKSPTEGDWRMSIPCLPEDVKWSNDKLAQISKRITARSFDSDVDDDSGASKSSSQAMSLNMEGFLKS